MNTISDRITGSLIALTGLFLYLILIPNSVEAVDSGWLLPETMPSALSLVLVVLGVALALKPGNQYLPPLNQFLMCGVYLGLIVVGLWAMSYLGFMIIGPLIALAVMLMIGERRIFWLGLGVAGMPLLIWVLLAWLLERALP